MKDFNAQQAKQIVDSLYTDELHNIGQFTCDKCQFKKKYSTGADEYPAYTTIEYCSKGHWESGDIPSAEDIDNWSNCADFLPCT